MHSQTPTPTFTTDSSRYLALLTRNPLAHTTFVYSVLTTRIYCRPTCPARPARRANIVFHDTATEAAAAGFRACKRCRPELASYDPQREVVQRACKSIERDVREGRVVGLAQLAKEVGWTKAHFQRVFRRVVGVTPGRYRERVVEGERRMGREALDGEGMMASENGDGVSSKSLSESPDTSEEASPVTNLEALLTDFSPQESHDRSSAGPFPLSNNRPIEFTIQPWFSGFVLIATTEDGICALDTADFEEELVETLRNQFPAADLTLSTWCPRISSTSSDQNSVIFSAVMEAIVTPTGKILDVPFDIM